MTRFALPVAAVLSMLAACTTKEPQKTTYYERTINPILTTSCVRTNTGAGCHVADAKGNAFGNLDLTSFEGTSKRKDLLTDYGPYGQPALLLKNVDPFQVEIRTYDGVSTTVTTDIKHAGGSILDPTATAYQTLRRWIQNGATANNTGVPPRVIERAACTKDPPGGRFDLTRDPPTPDFAVFRDQVNSVFNGHGISSSASCAAGNCHGNGSNSLFLTCGDTPEGLRWNYYAAQEYLAQSAEESELLRRPLAPEQGGAFHEGGVIFSSPSDAGYAALASWANAHGPAKVDRTDPGFVFFAHKVQPILVKKGCMMIQCHSASMFHDYRLHGGSGGSFSLSATRQNYDLSLVQLALESEDPNASRIVRKNLYRPEVCGVTGCDQPQGLVHRGGPLFEDFKGERASPKACDDAKYDFDKGDLDKIPAYCVILEWLRRERTARNIGPMTGIAYVRRPPGSLKRAQDFDVYTPGADLRIIAAKIENGALSVDGGNDKSVTAGCGLNPATADIRRPQVSWDGAHIAFAARASAGEPLEIYEMNADGSRCAKRDDLNGGATSANGLLIHNFDPTYASPDGGFTRIIFASTRGNLDKGNYDYDGPQRTPADPSKPNSNLYVWEPDPAAPAQGHVRQLTYLLDMERQPFVATDGRLVFVAEKRAPNFYQLALRRENLDTGDYHPLYAQRGTIGYPEASQVVELADRNFATIFSAQNQSAAGRLGVFNRSVGIDFTSTNPSDYLVDKSVIDPAQPAAPEPDFFLHSLRFPDGDPNARYTSPAALPMTELLVSFGAGEDFDVYTMSPTTGRKTKLFGEAGAAEVEAVAIYPRATRSIYRSSLDEPNGTTRIQAGYANADVHVLDFPVLASLLFQNTPTGRLVEDDITSFTVSEDLPPTPDVDSAGKAGSFGYQDAFGAAYARRRLLGTVPVNGDGSARFSIPGGVPIVLGLPATKESRAHALPRTQREAMEFAPGEVVHQSFKRELFGALCAQCHGSVSGRPVDTALVPDFVTQASETLGRAQAPVDLAKAPGARGAPGPAPAN